jgi:nucleoside-diphosphate-sugar epimerase
MNRTVVITGSSGLIGSALCAHLAPLSRVVAVDRRPPTEKLRRAAPGVRWVVCDIRQRDLLLRHLQGALRTEEAGAVVVHLAAHYHLGQSWSTPYTTTNIHGTLNVLAGAARIKASRLVFAGSIAAMIPNPGGGYLFEMDPAGESIAYTRSKAIAERLLEPLAALLPVVVIRLGGVFTPWCELPPLYSLIRLWKRSRPLGRILPGRGEAGFPYVHRQDAVEGIARVILCHHHLKPYEVLFIAPQGCTRQIDLFPFIYPRFHSGRQDRPVSIAAPWIRLLLHIQKWSCRLRGRSALEQPWMARYIDRPLRVDTHYTRERLDWMPDPERSIMRCLPHILDRAEAFPEVYRQRNDRRIVGHYQYCTDAL